MASALRCIAEYIVTTIWDLSNHSFNGKCFTTLFKQAIIKPIHKKDATEISNYGGIAL